MPSLLHSLLIASAEKHPDRAAVRLSGSSLSYSELVTRARKLAAWLVECGARPGDRIGLLSHKDIECYVAIYAILMAGCAYVPLDRRAPADRLSYIMKDCGINVLVCTGKALPVLLAKPGSLDCVDELIVLDDSNRKPDVDCRVSGPEQIAASVAGPDVHVVDSDLAYILYTSGSTGKPKGVMITHAVSMSFVNWAANWTKLVPSDNVSGHAPIHFDLSIFDVFATAMAGATLYPVPDGSSTFPVKLTDWIIANKITVWYSVPSILSMMTKQKSFPSRLFPDLRILLFAGEVFPVKYLRKWLDACPDTVLMNWYGPTETNVVTSYTVDNGDELSRPVPIGRPTSNAALSCIDASGKPVAGPDEVGELLVRGPCVALGYWGDDARTKEKFIANAQQPWLDDRVYRTGDLVALDSERNFIYLGRTDHQVKCRGYRIELGEVELALYRVPSIQEVAVIPVPDDLIGNRLTAFVTLAGSGELVPDHIIDDARTMLPVYMLPDRFIALNELPKTSNGKVDRQTLLRNAESLN